MIGATIESFISGESANTPSSNFQLILKPTAAGGGNITVDIGDNVVEDAAGNGNSASSQFSVFFDGSPSLRIQNQGIATSPFLVSFDFSEAVTGFDVSDIALTNGVASDFKKVNASQYRVIITPQVLFKQVIIEVPKGVANDADGIGNLAASKTVVGVLPIGTILQLLD